MLRGSDPQPGDGTAGVVLRHHTTGRYLARGALLAADAADALVFPSAAAARHVTSRFACEPGSFVIVPTPDDLAA
jgi:hypothetical protein